MAGTQNARTIRLDPLAGPQTEPVVVSSVKPHVLGRGGTSDIRLLDETVSRRHAQVWLAADTWLICDLESRHGTMLNGVRLSPNQAAPLRDGDLVALGPWTFIVRLSNRLSTTGFMTTQDDLAGGTQRVQKVPADELSIRAQHRLDLLTESAATIASATSEATLAEAVLTAVTQSTGVTRASFLRHVGSGEEVELVGYKGPPSGARMSFSRSLILAAAEGNVVRLEAGTPANFGMSIVTLGIHSAICAPVMTNGHPAAYIYLDARGGESAVAPDAAAFCQAVAKIAGLAIGNLRAAEIRQRQKELEGDLQAAHDAQIRLMPAPQGELPGASYAMRSIPGRLVAGDLFDVFALDDQRVAFFLGDVSGKGVGAALIMATAQSHLNSSLRQTGDPAAALTRVNRYVAHHCDQGKFISLFVGVITPQPDGTRLLSFVDAGHGYWLVRPTGEPVRKASFRGGLPVGVDDETQYENETMILQPGSRVVCFSDGVVEQTSPEGSDFGIERTSHVLQPAGNAGDDVNGLVKAVIDFAQPPSALGEESRGSGQRSVRLNDDMTVASIEIR